jgi:hypothetical protein
MWAREEGTGTVSIRMSLWGVAWWTCVQNVGAWMRVGECLTRCPHEMLYLGMP